MPSIHGSTRETNSVHTTATGLTATAVIDVVPHSKPNHPTTDMHFRVKPTVHVAKPTTRPPQSVITVGTRRLM